MKTWGVAVSGLEIGDLDSRHASDADSYGPWQVT